jgi:hypothetical protein
VGDTADFSHVTCSSIITLEETMFNRRFVLIVTLLLFPAFVLAGTGKLKGKVFDKETKEPLVGANIALEGTTMGAATNVAGEYVIINVPTGEYAVKASFIGYATTRVSGVRINSDLTTERNIELSSEAVALQAIEIVAERPLVNKNATNAVRITTSEDIANLPVRGVNNIIAASPGVVLQDNTVFIRGGRQDEVGFYLEGVSITNPMLGGRAVTLVQDAIEEIQVQAGGYNAEFGNANSGIVQAQLKSGTPKVKASLDYATDNVGFQGKKAAFDGNKRLGANWYGYNELTATLGGPVLGERLKFFGLFNYNYQRDATPQPYPGIDIGPVKDPITGDSLNLIYPAGALYKNSVQRYTGTATLNVDLSPVSLRFTGTYSSGLTFNPFTSRWPGNITNFLNSDRVERDLAWNGAVSGKLTHLLSSNTFYELSGGYFFQFGQNEDPILGSNFYSYGDSVANAQAGFVWTRKANDPTGRFIRPATPTIFNFAFTPRGDPIANFQRFDRTNFSINGAFYTQIGREHAVKLGGEYARYTMRNFGLGNEAAFALAGLIDQNNQLPAGDPLKQTLEEIMINRGVNNFGYNSTYTKKLDTDDFQGARHPVFAGAYIQDKIEYSDLVINAGLRLDYINTANYAFVDEAHPELSIDKSTGAVIPSGLRKTSAFTGVSPRLGLAFPVSDKTVFHAQFGKFTQQSRLRDIYQGLYSTGSSLRGGFFIPAPVGFDVRPTRTTQYEIGFTQQLEDFASIDITGYYKDIKDQVLYDQVYSGTGSPYGSYYTLVNGDFATTKGIELKFNMRRVKRVQVNASLALQDARGTGSYPNSNRGIVGAPLDGVTIFKPQYISPLEYNNSVRGSLNFDYRFGDNDGGPILQNLGLSMLFNFNSGHPFTRGIGGADLEGDARDRSPVEALNTSTTPWTFQVDLRLDKTIKFGALNANIYLFVINLLDTKNVENVFLRTGSTDDDGYLSNPALGGQLIATYGPVYEQLYRAINIDYYEQYQASLGNLSTTSLFFGPPRQVRLGIRLEI